MRKVQDLMMKRFKVIRILRLEEGKKTKGFFRVEKLLALWNSDHAALTLPKICFLGNFSEYPLSLAKGHRFTIVHKRRHIPGKWKYESKEYPLSHGFTIVESWEETFPEILTFSEWKLPPPPKLGGQSKTVQRGIRVQKRTNSHSFFIVFLEASRILCVA